MTPTIVTHGGAGAPAEWSDGPAAACRRGMDELRAGGVDAALRAVVEAAVVLEDDPRFDAGTGSFLRLDGSIQQDAIAATSDGRIGAVMCLDSTRNPIRVARLVMDSPHVQLCGDGATAFARERGFGPHDCSTPEARERHADAIGRLRTGQLRPAEQKWRGRHATEKMTGTIGAVARDAAGNFAVACSTGGTTMMLRGRVGDSPIFGAGVMVGLHGAVCCTGHGEEIVRHLVAMRCYLRLENGEAPQSAADAVALMFPAPYEVGLIVVGRDGHGIAHNAGSMASAVLTS